MKGAARWVPGARLRPPASRRENRTRALGRGAAGRTGLSRGLRADRQVAKGGNRGDGVMGILAGYLGSRGGALLGAARGAGERRVND